MDPPKLDFTHPVSNHCLCMLSKFPRFWRIDPEIWFIQVEAFFTMNNIIESSDKFTLLVANVDHSVLPYIADIVRNPPKDYEKKYSTVKQRILDVFAKDEATRLRELIRDNLHVVDRPSQLLKAMQATTGGRVDEQLIKSLFIRRVNERYRGSFSESQSIEEIGETADGIAASQEPFMGGFWDPLAPNHYLAQVQSKEIISSIVRCM